MSDGFIQTKSSKLRNGVVPEFKEVTFVSHIPKTKQEAVLSHCASKLKNVGEEIDMKKARSEIIKFAMSGMVGEEKHLSKQALAISLGAVPAKRKKQNYKILKEQRSKKKEKLNSDEPQGFCSSNQKALLSNKVLNRKASRHLSRKKKQSDILGIYGKVRKQDRPSK